MEKLNNRFMIDKKPIGKGSFGEVYLGVDLLTNKQKAIKMMYLKDELIYKNEVDILKKISSKNCFRHIICLTDYFIYKSRVVLITDKVEGISLDKFLYKGMNKMLKREDLIFIIYQLIYALKYIHEDLQIAHLDLKPGNIMIDPITYELSIIDFGLGCEDKCIVGGTRRYMSQEYYSKFLKKEKIKKEDGKKTDVYALGLIIYQIIYGADSILEYGEEFDKYILLETNLQEKGEFINLEYKKIKKELVKILKNTLKVNEKNRIQANELYKMIKDWKKTYEKRIMNPKYTRENETYLEESKNEVISPLLSILEKDATLVNE